MSLQKLKDNWQWYLMIIIANIACLWIIACPPTTTSLLEHNKQVTREELQLELETIVNTAKFRMANLDEQDELRNIILQNAVLIIETGTVNPLGILTGLLALYGAGSAITRGKKKVCDCLNNKKTKAFTNDSPTS